jgi:methionyl-tRNA formyltransferase
MNWAIINGETQGTATIHYATNQIDAGDIVAEQQFPIREDDTIADVRDRTLDIFPELLVDAVAGIEHGTVEPRPQNVSGGVYWGSRKPQDGHIRWKHMTAKEVYNFVRALTHPYPGAFCTYQGECLFVWETKRMDRTVKHTPGRVLWARGNGRVVAARDRALVLETVQPADGEERPAAPYLEHGEYLS